MSRALNMLLGFAAMVHCMAPEDGYSDIVPLSDAEDWPSKHDYDEQEDSDDE